MGMFDEIKCRFPLPIDGANSLLYQTKDTPEQFCGLYEIREDGTLWHEEYDIEDQSEMGKWKSNNPGIEIPEELKGLSSFIGCMTRVNQRWSRVMNFTGEVIFYTTLPPERSGWIEWSAYFENGQLIRMNLVNHRTEGK